MLRLSIVVPTFNESRNVRELLHRLEATLGATGWEVIFVDDDSPDGTATEVRNIAQLTLVSVAYSGLSEDCLRHVLRYVGHFSTHDCGHGRRFAAR